MGNFSKIVKMDKAIIFVVVEQKGYQTKTYLDTENQRETPNLVIFWVAAGMAGAAAVLIRHAIPENVTHSMLNK